MTNREIAAALFVTAKTVEAGYIASWASATVPNRLAYQRASRL